MTLPIEKELEAIAASGSKDQRRRHLRQLLCRHQKEPFIYSAWSFNQGEPRIVEHYRSVCMKCGKMFKPEVD